MLTKNEIVNLNIDGYNSEGYGVARHEGQVVFVAGALLGESVEAKIVKVLKNVCYAIIQKMLVSSKHREGEGEIERKGKDESCPVYPKCGGCDTRHMDYSEELRFKSEKVKSALSKFAGINLESIPIIGAENTTFYRNKAQFPVKVEDGKAVFGFYRNNSHDITPIDNCLCQSESANALARAVRAYIDETGAKIRHIYVRVAEGTHEVMLCVVSPDRNIPQSKRLLELAKNACPSLKSLVLNINRDDTNVILGKKCKTLWGSDTITDKLGDLLYQISPLSFYQINHAQTKVLYDKAAEYAGLTGVETLLDLYCGAGTIGLFMARRAAKVFGIEAVPEAITNAEENARINNIKNAQFVCADASDTERVLKEYSVKPDVIIVDPPRKGLSAEAIDAILKSGAKRLVYVSCDCATMARDIKLLSGEYELKNVTAVDLFPRTKHVECVVLMSRNK